MAINLNFKNWLRKLFGGDVVYNVSLDDEAIPVIETYYRDLAFWSCVTLIANAISKCEFRTYLRGEEVKQNEYYLWNIQPNRNQNSTQFIQKLIAQLYSHNEALVVASDDGQLLVADSFTREEYAVYDDIFSQVTVKDYTFSRTFTQSEVLYFRLADKNIKDLVDKIYSCHANLMQTAIKGYRNARGTKGIFKYESYPVNPKEEEAFKSLLNSKLKQFFQADSDIVLPLGKGQDLLEFGKEKTYSSENTRDIRALIDDIFDFTAKAFGIPPMLIKGEVQDVSTAINQFLTFCIDPLVDTLQEEIIRKRIGRDEFLRGTKLVIDTRTIKHIDLFEAAPQIDKLVSSGCFCVNDIRTALGYEPINENWANEYFITKNYAPVEEVLNQISNEQEGDNANED